MCDICPQNESDEIDVGVLFFTFLEVNTTAINGIVFYFFVCGAVNLSFIINKGILVLSSRIAQKDVLILMSGWNRCLQDWISVMNSVMAWIYSKQCHLFCHRCQIYFSTHYIFEECYSHSLKMLLYPNKKKSYMYKMPLFFFIYGHIWYSMIALFTKMYFITYYVVIITLLLSDE